MSAALPRVSLPEHPDKASKMRTESRTHLLIGLPPAEQCTTDHADCPSCGSCRHRRWRLGLMARIERLRPLPLGIGKEQTANFNGQSCRLQFHNKTVKLGCTHKSSINQQHYCLRGVERTHRQPKNQI